MHCFLILFLLLQITVTANAQQVAVAADKMNVLYIGIPNPVTIAVENTACKDIIVELNGGGKITADESMHCHFDIAPTNPGKILVNVYKKQGGNKVLVGKQEFRCKNIPDPVARVGGRANGEMCLNIFKAQLGVILTLDGFDFDARMIIEAYTIAIVRQDEPLYEKKCSGARFDEETVKQFRDLKIGDKVIISDIKFRSPNSQIRMLNQEVNLTMKVCK